MKDQLQSIHAFCNAWKQLHKNDSCIYIRDDHIIAFFDYIPDIYYINVPINIIQEQWLSLGDEPIDTFILDYMERFRIHYR